MRGFGEVIVPMVSSRPASSWLPVTATCGCATTPRCRTKMASASSPQRRRACVLVLHPRPREQTQQACHAAADHPGADDRDPVAEHRCCVPQRVDSSFDGPSKHGTSWRHVFGHERHGARRYDVGSLVRVVTEDRSAAQFRRSVLHSADVEVAVLDGPRELPLLERRPHRAVLARRHPAPEHQCLSAAANPRP